MKKLIIFLVLATSSAFAANKDIIAKYDFTTLSGDANSYTQYSVILAGDGELTVKSGAFPSILTDKPNDLDTIATEQLSRSVFKILKDEVVFLSNTKVKVFGSGIICMIAVHRAWYINSLYVARDYDYSKDTFEGEKALIDGPHGCWVGYSTRPEMDYADERAHGVKQSLKVLGLQAAGI